MASLRARILLSVSAAAVLATGYAASNGRIEATVNSVTNSVTQRMETGASTAARIIDDYGIYAARLANPRVGLEVLKESLTQLRDIALPDNSQPPQCRGIADLHAHVPADIDSEDLEFIINTARERGVELIAITSYPTGLMEKSSGASSSAGGYNIKPAMGAVSDAVKRIIPGIGYGVSGMRIDEVRPGGLAAIDYERFLEVVKASPYGLNRKGAFSEITKDGEVVLRVLKAQEIWTETGFHVIVYGGRNRYRAGLPIEELARQATHDQPRLVVAAHPFLQGMPGRIGITGRRDEEKLAELLREGLIDGIETANPHSIAPLNALARLLLYNSPNSSAIGTAGSDAHYFSRRSREMAKGIGLTGVALRGTVDYGDETVFLKSLRNALDRHSNAPRCVHYGDLNSMFAMIDLQMLAERKAAHNN